MCVPQGWGLEVFTAGMRDPPGLCPGRAGEGLGMEGEAGQWGGALAGDAWGPRRLDAGD